jgi:hypothetical protein
MLTTLAYAQHKEKMGWLLQDIRDTQYCEACNKRIIRYVYSARRSDMVCCSMQCVDKLTK